MPKHQRNMQMHPIVVRELEVLRVEDITSGMRRIIFGGSQLQAHDFGPHRIDRLHSTGFDDDVRLIFPDPATGERPRPQLNEQTEESQEIQKVLKVLETQYDQDLERYVARSEQSSLATESSMPTGDELGAKFERFLQSLDSRALDSGSEPPLDPIEDPREDDD